MRQPAIPSSAPKHTSAAIGSYLLPTLMLLVMGIVLYLNFSSLLTVPVPNSSIYFQGDESWLLSEYRSMMEFGKFFHPNAPGSTLAHGGGLVFGNMWVTAILYGLPQILLALDPITVGRSVTFVVALTTLFVMYRILRREGCDPVWGLSGILFLVSTPCFIVMSHSARYDMLIGLSNLVVLAILVTLCRRASLRPMHYLFWGIGEVLLATIGAHLVLQTSLACVFALWITGCFGRWQNIVSYLAGISIGVGLLIFSQFVQWGSVSLFGPQPAVPSIYESFFHAIPFFHPFELQRQLTNITGRVMALWDFAPAYTVAFAVLTGCLIVNSNVRHSISAKPQRTWFTFVALLVVANLFLENRDEKYLIYILPALTVYLVLFASHTITDVRASFVVFVAVFISSAFGIQWGAEAKAVGDRIVRAQNLVAQTARTIVERDHRVRTKRVLFYPPIVHFAWNGCEPITTMFLKLPSTTRSVQQVLAEAKAGYALTLTYSLITDDVLEEHRVTELLQKTATPIATWVGEHTDYSTVYGQAISWGVDTLTLYRLDSIQ